MGKDYLDVLRSVSEGGHRGAFLNGDHSIFARARKPAREVVALLIALYDQHLIERVPKSAKGWFRVTAAGRKQLASPRKRVAA